MPELSFVFKLKKVVLLLQVVDIESGSALGAGKDGEILVKGPLVMKGVKYGLYLHLIGPVRRYIFKKKVKETPHKDNKVPPTLIAFSLPSTSKRCLRAPELPTCRFRVNGRIRRYSNTRTSQIESFKIV